MLQWMKDILKGRKMRTVLRSKYLSRKEVISGVPQGSVVPPKMFSVKTLNNINDDKGIELYMNTFADDAKVYRKRLDENLCAKIQNNLTKIRVWKHK